MPLRSCATGGRGVQVSCSAKLPASLRRAGHQPQRSAKRIATRVPPPGREVTSMLEAACRISRRPRPRPALAERAAVMPAPASRTTTSRSSSSTRASSAKVERPARVVVGVQHAVGARLGDREADLPGQLLLDLEVLAQARDRAAGVRHPLGHRLQLDPQTRTTYLAVPGLTIANHRIPRSGYHPARASPVTPAESRTPARLAVPRRRPGHATRRGRMESDEARARCRRPRTVPFAGTVEAGAPRARRRDRDAARRARPQHAGGDSPRRSRAPAARPTSSSTSRSAASSTRP